MRVCFQILTLLQLTSYCIQGMYKYIYKMGNKNRNDID